MDQLAIMALQTAQEYAQKMAAGPLTEYEAQLYERICRWLTTYFTGAQFALRKQLPELEQDALQAELEHQSWLDAHDDDNDDETPVIA